MAFVTHQELMKALPKLEEDIVLLDEVYALFIDLGIEVMDAKDKMLATKEVKT
jgi:hypothetical protein